MACAGSVWLTLQVWCWLFASMRIGLFVALSVSLLMPHLASAERSRAALLLEGDLAAHAPAAWQVHVSERPEGLVAFIIPPYQEGFDLWYQPSLLKARMITDSTAVENLSPAFA